MARTWFRLLWLELETAGNLGTDIEAGIVQWLYVATVSMMGKDDNVFLSAGIDNGISKVRRHFLYILEYTY